MVAMCMPFCTFYALYIDNTAIMVAGQLTFRSTVVVLVKTGQLLLLFINQGKSPTCRFPAEVRRHHVYQCKSHIANNAQL